jgi:hypothetical protein
MVQQTIIDTTFNMHSDAKGGDPDSKSPTLRSYHNFLWNKTLPNGKVFELTNKKSGFYLYHKSDLGEFSLGSDTITHSYRKHKQKIWLTQQIQEDVNELFNLGSTIGAFTIFPNNKIDGKYTINQERGVNKLIDDRFDLTLECIRLFYVREESPLYYTLLRYKNFFDLFVNFEGYIKFFLLDDLVDENQKIKFYLPFDNFKTRPTFTEINDYLIYKQGVMNFINSRNKRIELYSSQLIKK